MKRVIGILTIGQSPRDDVVPEITEIIGPGVTVQEAGALDGLSEKEIASLKPRRGDYVLVTRLRDGSSVTTSREKLMPLMQERIRKLEEKGVDLIVPLCTGGFPGLRSKAEMVRPDRIIKAVVEDALPMEKLVVVVPSEGQVGETKRRWGLPGIELVIEAYDPYEGTRSEGELAEAIAESDPDLILLECIGYGRSLRDRIEYATGKPVVLARASLASAIRETMGIGRSLGNAPKRKT